MLVAIHQPNFFPWLGYFNKIARADVFCLMDNAQMPKTGGCYVNRVQLALNGRPAWMTAPVDRSYSGVRSIAQVRLSNKGPWRQNLLKTLRAAFGRAAFFQETYALLEPLILNPTDRLAEYNTAAIRALCAALGLDHCRLVLGSELAVSGQATELLINMVRAVGGDAYLCGGGAGGYQEDEKFAAAGIQLVYQQFRHPVYKQGRTADFVPGLSIIDALMHCGLAGTAELVRGKEPSKEDKVWT
jgi:hypothetical protein